MAVSGVKFDDGRSGFASNCFPVRSLGQTTEDANGAWLIAQHAEQRRRFKAVLCAKPRTYSRIKEERKKSELQGTKLESHKFDDDDDEEYEEADDDGKILDGFFLMKHCCVDDPSDLCSVNIANKELTDVKEDDLMLFENVAYVNAGENYLPFEAFRGFPSLRELEIPLNGLRNLQISHTDFTNLEMLDLSYNNLSHDDLLTLGLLTHLKVLHLTGNNFKNLPQDLAMPYLSREKQVRLQRFACLEVLLLDDNKLMDMTVFAALAGLPKLRHLNMSKNDIFYVPQLKSVEGRVITQDGKEKKPRDRPASGRKSSRRTKSRNSTRQTEALIDLEADKTAGKEGILDSKDEKVQPENGQEKREESGLDRTDTNISEDPIYQELMAEDFSTGDLSARIKELDTEGDLTGEPTQQQPTGPKLPPFPELRYLNLSNNKIYEEDALLAVAAWPMLVELDIYDNPLTTERSGDPPLLKRFLQDRLGIKLNRTKPPEVAGMMKKGNKVEIRPKHRKITEVVPKVPKLTLEEKMMLELPPPPVPKAIEHGSSPVLRQTRKGSELLGNRDKSVLPPIATTPKEELTQAWAEKITEEEEEDFDEEEIEERKRAGMDREPSDTFFMTQLDDIGERHDRPAKREISFAEEHATRASTMSEGKDKLSEQKTVVDDRYKGYELLLDIEDLEGEPELPPARDVQGNIRALKHTLNHMLVYRDPAVELNKVKKMVPEFRRVPVPPAKPHPSYQERMDDVMVKLKSRSTLEEEKLTTVFKDKTKYHRQFPEAEDLLAQIQRRYNAVRVHSMKDAKQAKEITENMVNLLPVPPPKAE